MRLVPSPFVHFALGGAGRMPRGLAPLGLALGVALAAYGHNAPAAPAFYGGVVLFAAALVRASGVARREGATGTALVLNTVVCFWGGVLLLDLYAFATDPGSAAAPPEPVYSFEAARGDPERLEAWWNYNLEEWLRSQRDYMRPDPSGVHRFVLVPGARGRFFDVEIRINQLGFRGREIARDKGDHYRIVALGESTTYGATVRSGDRPWPELLEERLPAALGCAAPVEVVNAGVPAWTLADNLARLDAQILSLEPDLIVSYHGSNGFPYLLEEIPAADAGLALRRPPRPSRFLARIENALHLWQLRRRYDRARRVAADVLERDLLGTRYAKLYLQLVRRARARGVAVALATFNLAVDADSPAGAVRFYELAFPDVRARILANQMHSRLIREVARREGVLALDTSPGLDGAYADAYVDLLHFTQLGRERLTANLLRGLAPLLRAEPRMRCAEAAGAASPRPPR